MYRKYVYLSGVLLLAIVISTNGGEPYPQQGRIVELLGIKHLVPDAIIVATDECTMLADGNQCRVPQPSEKMHSVHPLLLELSQEAADWIFNDIAPCGEGPNGRTICASTAPPPAGKYVVIIVTYEADTLLRHTSHSFTHGLTFDADGIASNNYVPFPDYPYDFYTGTDLWYELVYDPDSGWQLWVTDVWQGFADVASNARVLIAGSEMAWFVPLQELDGQTGVLSLEHGIRPLGLDDLIARFRVTVHRWLQNWGLDGSFWSACLWPIVGDPLAQIPATPIAVRAEAVLPILTLTGGSVWGGCPDEILGQEVTILSFSLSADDVDSWQVGSFRFESSGSGNEYEHIEEVRLYEGDVGSRELIVRSIYLQDDESITLTPIAPLFVPRGETINLDLAYLFKEREWIRCPFDQDFKVRTRPDWITAIPVTVTNGRKEGKEIEGIIVFGCVKNTNTNKVFSKIQDAIDDEETKDGHTIIVCPGTYVENVLVTKNRLTIRSRDGRDSTIVQAQNPDDSVFTIWEDNITIDGFTIKSGNEGIYIERCKGNKIVKNNITDNINNGILFWDCKAEKDSPNLIESNIIQGNEGDGVLLFRSHGTNIVHNIIGQNNTGIFLNGPFYSRWSPPNLIGGNLIQGNRSHGVYFLESFDNIVIGNRLLGNYTGIVSIQSRNDIHNNVIESSGGSSTGIHLDGSSSEIIGNIISDDAGDGIRCENGANPTVRKNNITNNTGFGLNNIDILVNIDAQENWWGDASGPGGAGPGTGDEVSENVDFSNWMTAPVALVVTSGWDVYGARGTDVNATFYVANMSDFNDTYDINVSDTLGWPLDPITLTETIIAGQSNEILINVSIPLDALNGTEDEIILTATSTSNPTVTDSATLKVTVGEIWMIIDDFSVGAPPLTVINHDGVFPLKDGTTVQSPMILGGEFDAVINLVSADLGDGASAEIRGGSLHYTQDASCTAVLIFHYDGNDGSWEQVHASTGLGGGIDITNGGTYDRIRVTFLNNVSSFVMGVVLFTDQANSSEAKMTVPVSADPFTVEYLFEGLVHQGNGADLTNVRTILFLAGSGGGMTGLMDFEIDGIWAIPVDETPPPPVAALSNSWGFCTSYLLPRWWP